MLYTCIVSCATGWRGRSTGPISTAITTTRGMSSSTSQQNTTIHLEKDKIDKKLLPTNELAQKK